MLVPFEDLPLESRIWIYPSSRKFSDEEITAGAMKTLRFLFGDEVPEPEGFVITRWGQDEFSYGAYSHIPPFANGDDLDALAEPVNDLLYFAGEATHRKFPATVHGAYLSGVKVGESTLTIILNMVT